MEVTKYLLVARTNRKDGFGHAMRFILKPL